MLTDYYRFSRPEVRQLVPKHAIRILDVGCAAGALGEALKRENPEREVTGIEITPEAAKEAGKVLDRVVIGDIEQLATALPYSHFDCLILADVIEHLRDPWAALTRLCGALQPGASIVASVPNVGHWSVIRGLLEGNWEYTDAGLLDRTHLRFFTLRTVKKLFRELGWDIVTLVPVFATAGGQPPRGLIDEALKAGIRAENLAAEAQVYQYLIGAVYSAKTCCARRDEKVSIIIPCFNGLSFTRACVESIYESTSRPFELILVDNGSSDGTGNYIASLALNFSNVRLISNEYNLGFAAACNQGLAVASGDFFVLLNNDTLATDGWLDGLIGHLEEDPSLGIVGPCSNYVAGLQMVPEVPYELGSMPEEGNAKGREALSRFARDRALRFAGSTRLVPRIIGLCMAGRRQLIERIGGFDLRFGVGNFEDDDFCLRVLQAGYRICIAEDVFIHHYGSKTFAESGIDYTHLMRRNWRRFCDKWGIPHHQAGSYNALAVLSHARQQDPVPLSLEATLLPDRSPEGTGKPLGVDAHRIPRLWPGDVFSFLVTPDWSGRSLRWVDILRAYLSAFPASNRRVCMVLRVDPVDVPSVDPLVLSIRSTIKSLGLDPDEIPDVLVSNEYLPWPERTWLFAAASAYIPSGEAEQGLHTYQAQLGGVRVIQDVYPDALRHAAQLHDEAIPAPD